MFNIIVCCIGVLFIFPKEYLASCISNRCYTVINVSLKYSGVSCDVGSHIVEILNEQIQNDLESFLPDGDYWIGLDDIDSEGNYKWSSGASLTYENFSPSHSNNNGHDCVGMSSNNNWKWHNANCKHKKKFICAYQGTSVQETTVITTTTPVTTTTLETTTTSVTTTTLETTKTPVTTTTLETTTTPVTTTTLETTTPVTTTTLETATSAGTWATQIMQIWCPDLNRTFSFNGSETVTPSAQLRSLLNELDDQGDAIQEAKKKRRNTSAPDERVSSQTIGLIGVAILSSIGLFILIMDLSSLKRDLTTLRGNLCPSDSHIIEV